MTLQQIRQFGMTLAAQGWINDSPKWEIDCVLTIEKKMFVLADVSKSPNNTTKSDTINEQNQCVWLMVKVDSERFLEYTDRVGIIPAPYLARAGWVQFTDTRQFSTLEIETAIARSYALIAAKLSKRTQALLGTPKAV